MHNISIAVVASLLLFVVADAGAQFPGGGQGGRGGTGATSGLPAGRSAQDRRQQGAPDTPISVMGQVQVQLDRLEEDLRINHAQQAMWDAYARRVIRLADDVARARFAARAAQDAPPSTALQQFDRLSDTARNRVTAVDEIAEAGRALYAVLTPEQKALADRRLALVALPLANGVPPSAPPRPDDGALPAAQPRVQ